MPRKAEQSTTWDFKVSPQRLYLPPALGGGPSNVWGNVREDTGQVVGVVSEKGYGLVQNSDFVKTIREALDGLGLTGYTEHLLSAGAVGERFYASFRFSNRVRTIHNVGDQVGMVLRFANSFDGSLAAIAELRAEILRCKNGMTMEKGKFALQRRHTAKISLDFVQEVITAAVNDFDESLQVFGHLGGVNITEEQGMNVIKRLPGFAPRVQEKVAALWLRPNHAQGRERTLYAVYDAVTEHLRDLEATRFEQAAKLNRQALRALVSGLDPDKLAVLVSALPEEQAAEVVEVEAEVSAATGDFPPGPPTE